MVTCNINEKIQYKREHVLYMGTCTVNEECKIKFDPKRFRIQHIISHKRENFSFCDCVTDLFGRTIKKHFEKGFPVTNHYLHA